MPRVASVQMDVKYGDRDHNVGRVVQSVRDLAVQGVDIAVFPECCLAGYCVEFESELPDIGISKNSYCLTAIQSVVDETGLVVVFGFAECDGTVYYNSAALMQPHAPVNFYRKTHLPELGYDRFVTKGGDLPVFETKYGKVGILICFDIRFPEATRILALKGIDVLLLPTNWPTGADISADLLAVARAAENKIFIVTSNRVGIERGFEFIGKSKLISPMGEILAGAGNGEEILIADLEFSLSRNKRNVTVPGKHETTIFDSRRPELYGPILD
jgi:predicted amidohydrolase